MCEVFKEQQVFKCGYNATKQVQCSLGLALYAGRWDNPVISAHALCYCFQRDVIIACVYMALHVAENFSFRIISFAP